MLYQIILKKIKQKIQYCALFINLLHTVGFYKRIVFSHQNIKQMAARFFYKSFLISEKMLFSIFYLLYIVRSCFIAFVKILCGEETYKSFEQFSRNHSKERNEIRGLDNNICILFSSLCNFSVLV